MRRSRLTLLFLAPLAVGPLGCGDADRVTTDGPRLDGSAPPADAAGLDLGPPRDAQLPDASEAPDAGPPAALVDLTFGAGCAPTFDGDVVVVRNAESIAVSSTAGGILTGSVQLALDGVAPGTETLSSQHRVDTGYVVNVITDTTWTNLAMDSGAVLGGTEPDPIDGTLRIDEYDEAAGRIDVTFTGVTLQNPSTGTVCTVAGRLQTTRLSF